MYFEHDMAGGPVVRRCGNSALTEIIRAVAIRTNICVDDIVSDYDLTYDRRCARDLVVAIASGHATISEDDIMNELSCSRGEIERVRNSFEYDLGLYHTSARMWDYLASSLVIA